MAEKVAEKSLTDLSLAKTLLSRRDTEQAAQSGKYGEQNKFKSYMRSFIDNKDNRTVKGSSNNKKKSFSQKDAVFGLGAAGKTDKSRNSSVKQDKGGIGSNRMTAEERSELRKALSKTTAEEEHFDEQFDCLNLFYNSFISNPALDGDLSFQMTDQEMLDAANEAAQLIWGLLFPGGVAGAEGNGPNSLAELASYLRSSESNPSLAGSDSVGLGEADLAATNASAEMNIDAVLANLEELLDGMPRGALEQALRRTATAAGLSPESAFQTAAEQMGLEISVDSASYNPGDLLSSLQGGYYTAESAVVGGKTLTVEEAIQKLSEFGQNLDSMLTDPATGLSKDVVKWLSSEDNPFNKSLLSEDSAEVAEGLVNSLNAYLGKSSETMSMGKSEISAIISNLEKVLQLSQNKVTQSVNFGTGSEMIMGNDTDAQDEVLSGVAKTNDLARDSAQAGNANTNSTAAQAAGKPTATSSSTSSMLDQMANIERLTEILRLNNRNGVRNLTMQLSPPDLGKVMVRVESRNGVVSATFRVEQADSASQLQNGMQQLRDNLRAHGIEVGEFLVQQDNFSANADGHGQNRNADPEFSFDNRQRGSFHDDDADDENLVHSASQARNNDGSLNLFA